jgi:hypothetical protein
VRHRAPSPIVGLAAWWWCVYVLMNWDLWPFWARLTAIGAGIIALYALAQAVEYFHAKYIRFAPTVYARCRRWRTERPIFSTVIVVLLCAVIIGTAWRAIALRTSSQTVAVSTNTPTNDPSTFAKYSLEFAMLQDGKIIKHHGSIDAVTIEFRLVNTTFPQAEIHNVFGNIWIDSAFFLDSTLAPSVAGTDRTEWDVQIPVLPRGGAFAQTSIRVRMPGPNERVIIGAQFVSKETNKRDYMWNLTNDNGRPTTVIVRK